MEWIKDTPDVSYPPLEKWVVQRYKLNLTNSRGYVQLLLRLSLITTFQGGHIKLTQLADRVLHASSDEQLKIVAEQLLYRCNWIPQLLEIYLEFEEAVHTHDVMDTLFQRCPHEVDHLQIEYGVLWLASLGCLKLVQRQIYQITDLGEQLVSRYLNQAGLDDTSITANENLLAEVNVEIGDTDVHELIQEISEAAIDSNAPRRMELAVMNIFQYLGFQATHLGKPGEGDVLVQANIGEYSYRIVVDAKSRRDGKVHNLDVYKLQQHRQKENAEYAIVIAKSFAGGKQPIYARENSITLMTVEVLVNWLLFHSTTPLNINDYRVVFSKAGLVTTLPYELSSYVEEHNRWINLAVHLMEVVQEAYQHGLNAPLYPSQLLPMLIMRQKTVAYKDEEIEQVINWLSCPAINAILLDDRGGINLVTNRGTVAHILGIIANQIGNDI